MMVLDIIAIFFFMVSAWAAHRGDYGWAVWFFAMFLSLLSDAP
jgi:hypothetical protein